MGGRLAKREYHSVIYPRTAHPTYCGAELRRLVKASIKFYRFSCTPHEKAAGSFLYNWHAQNKQIKNEVRFGQDINSNGTRMHSTVRHAHERYGLEKRTVPVRAMDGGRHAIVFPKSPLPKINLPDVALTADAKRSF